MHETPTSANTPAANINNSTMFNDLSIAYLIPPPSPPFGVQQPEWQQHKEDAEWSQIWYLLEQRRLCGFQTLTIWRRMWASLWCKRSIWGGGASWGLLWPSARCPLQTSLWFLAALLSMLATSRLWEHQNVRFTLLPHIKRIHWRMNLFYL